jgi:hypothetical protein
MENISIRYLFDKRNIASSTKQGLLQIEVRMIGTNRSALVSMEVKLYKWFLCLDFVNGIVINEFGNNYGLLMFEKAYFFLFALKPFF